MDLTVREPQAMCDVWEILPLLKIKWMTNLIIFVNVVSVSILSERDKTQHKHEGGVFVCLWFWKENVFACMWVNSWVEATADSNAAVPRTV